MMLFILSLFTFIIFVMLKTKKALHMLQQNWYDDDHRYLKWILVNPYKVFIELDMLFPIFIAFIFVNEKIAFTLFTLFYLIISILYNKRVKKEQSKKPLVFTKRVKRICMTLTVLYLIPVVTMILTYDSTSVAYYYLFLGLLSYLNYFIVMTANFLNKPIEKGVFNYYKRQAMNKIKSMKGIKIVGITGSYGKTSSKNILNDILNVKFNSFATPKSFNTMNGLMLSINNYLDKFNDVFIAEMGAFKIGEIQELCDFIKPQYGILTKIGTAHLETFGSQENIQKGKFELIDSLPDDGIAVLNMDDELQVSYKRKSKCKVVWIGINNKEADIYATNIKLSSDGTRFDCVFKGSDKKYRFETKLLGQANVYNILAGIALGYEFGMTIEQIQLGVKKVNVIEHRLELKKYLDINIIDDAYNSNPVGSKMALEVLSMMPGKKIVVTPGMIELGDKQFELNMEFGKYIADVCDEVILVGEEQTKPIYEGLINKDYDKKKIHILNDVKEAFPLMQKLKEENTYVLLENDLPDIFNEK